MNRLGGDALCAKILRDDLEHGRGPGDVVIGVLWPANSWPQGRHRYAANHFACAPRIVWNSLNSTAVPLRLFDEVRNIKCREPPCRSLHQVVIDEETLC